MLLKGLEEEEQTFSDSHCHSDFEKSWEDYWEKQGPALVWQNWLDKYKEFINPEFLDDTLDPNAAEFAEENPITETSWTQVWQDHQQQQFDYYHKWFSDWWSQSQLEKNLNNLQLSENCDQEDRFSSERSEMSARENDDLSVDSEFDATILNRDLEPKEQKHKSSLEKSADYIIELGFSTTLSDPSSNVATCTMETKLTKKRKRKNRKKVNLGRVPAQSTCSVSKVIMK